MSEFPVFFSRALETAYIPPVSPPCQWQSLQHLLVPFSCFALLFPLPPLPFACTSLPLFNVMIHFAVFSSASISHQFSCHVSYFSSRFNKQFIYDVLQARHYHFLFIYYCRINWLQWDFVFPPSSNNKVPFGKYSLLVLDWPFNEFISYMRFIPCIESFFTTFWFSSCYPRKKWSSY